MKRKSLVITILIVTIISYIILGLIPNNVYAADMAAGTLSRDIDQIDENLYPGYKQLIKSMQAKHPNYVFLAYYTGLNWDEVLTAEYQGHGTSPWNLVQVGEKYNGMWICPLCGASKYDNGSWCCASLDALSYMMDPRNSINDSDVFQFKDLSGSDVSYNDIARVVSGYGSYINNAEAIQAIVDASKQYNINGYFLVTKIINEHGKNGSTLSNGKGYNGNYVGIYNYFNINASGNGVANIINSGLSYAQKQGWTSIRASIFGGTKVVKESYMDKHSQNTFYYQKFNVSGRDTLGTHQYQQNIMAAQSQGTSLKAYYGSSTNGIFTFIIPLYKNMPKIACARPDSSKPNSITYEEGTIKNVSTSLTVRAAGRKNALAIGKLNNNEPIKILRKADSQVDGYYWDLIVTNKGTYGYAARYVGGDQCIVPNGSTGTSSGGASQTKPEEKPEEPTTPPIEPAPIPEVDIEKDIKINEEECLVSPEVTCEHILEKYEEAKITDKDGKEALAGSLGTGYKITIEEKTYTVVKKGDVNGDGNISIIDAVTMLNSIKGIKVLENEYKSASLVKNSEEITITDVVVVLNHIKGILYIGL